MRFFCDPRFVFDSKVFQIDKTGDFVIFEGQIVDKPLFCLNEVIARDAFDRLYVNKGLIGFRVVIKRARSHLEWPTEGELIFNVGGVHYRFYFFGKMLVKQGMASVANFKVKRVPYHSNILFYF